MSVIGKKAVLLLLLVALCSCRKPSESVDNSADDGTNNGATQQVTLIDTINLPVGGSSQIYQVTVPEGSASLTIMADGGDAGDIDISSLITPNGEEWSSIDPDNGPIGFNFMQGQGQSAVAFTLPHSGDYRFTPGVWSFVITHWNSSDGLPRNVSVYTQVKETPGTVIDINVWMVAPIDYLGENDPNLLTLLDRLKVGLGALGLTLGNVNVIELQGADAERLTILDINSDANGNGQADGMDELFRLSSQADNNYVNFFLIRSFSTVGILGIAAGIPGPQLIQGTAHSGVVVSTLGGLSKLSAADISMQGDTMAHELGHFLGLFHTSERSGLLFDPISDTPQCSAATNDRNGDGLLSPGECADLDGSNIMFWAAADYPQESSSAMQRDVIQKSAAPRQE